MVNKIIKGLVWTLNLIFSRFFTILAGYIVLVFGMVIINVISFMGFNPILF